MTGREILTNFKFKGDHATLDKIEHQLEAVKHRLEFLTGIELVKGLFELGERFSKFGEELHAASTAAGIGVENFQKLTYAAGQSAVSQDELSNSLRVLNKHLYEVRQGGEGATKAFKAAGFDPEQVKGFKNSQEALLAISDRFKKIKDPIEKAALSQELLGRSSTKMIGFLNEGSGAIKRQMTEAEQLGLVLGEDQVEALKSLEDALSRVMALFKAMAATIAATVAPLMEHIIGQFMKFVIANRALIEVNVENWLMDLAFMLGFLWEAMKYGFGILQKIADFFGMGDRVLSFVTALMGLVTVLKILIPVLGFFLSPLGLIMLAVGALVILVHDLYAAFNGEQTWLNKFVEWAKTLTFVKNIISVISGLWEKFTNTVPMIAEAMKTVFKYSPIGLLSKLASFGGKDAEPSQGEPASVANTSVVGGSTAHITAPISITVPPGTPPGEVGKAVQDGIGDHFGRIMRETKSSTQTPVAY